jgi:hypothetical protein
MRSPCLPKKAGCRGHRSAMAALSMAIGPSRERRRERRFAAFVTLAKALHFADTGSPAGRHSTEGLRLSVMIVSRSFA